MEHCYFCRRFIEELEKLAKKQHAERINTATFDYTETVIKILVKLAEKTTERRKNDRKKG
jgi:hypothetical protein